MTNETEKTYRCAPIRIQLQEGGQVEQIPTRVQLLRTGTFFDPRYGKVEITKDKLDHMVQKFGEGVRGVELMIDYKHDSEAEAAGWIKALEVIEVQLTEADEEKGIEETSEFQLWSDVEWTTPGAKKLSNKEFAYLSADFHPEYKDNENPEVNHGHVLLGAALTNRPVIKRMNPAIQLSESETISTDKKEISKMEKDQEQKLADLESENTQLGGKLEKVKGLMSELGVESIEDLMKMISEMRTENETLLSEKATAEKKTQLDELLKDGKINAAQHEGAMKLSEDEFKGFVSMTKVGEKVVKLSETGTNETPGEENNDDDSDPQDQVIELAESKMKENKGMSFSEATAEVLKENKELSKKYNESL